jgi:Asp-tRNA(Asn)/Glu-tRNA(Gln) amidotransferase A subunit family amidase
MKTTVRLASAALALVGTLLLPPTRLANAQTAAFQVEEATIADIQSAILREEVTSTRVVELYLARIAAYNGTCVNQPQGILGPVTTIRNAGKINALITVNLRPAARRAWGFDDRKARSMTDTVDNDPAMLDALEVAARQDAHFARTGQLIGPLHGVVLAIKDQYDTYDMRTTSGADAFYANDRPPDDATFVKRLRDAGAILLAKANMGEYATGGIAGTRSSFGGPNCNAYDTERDPGASSGGSGNSVAANLVTCAIGEETGTSIREPAKNASAVGLAPTRELVSADGMMQRGITTRVGPICRTVQDVARILDAYAGYDPKDELTAFSVGRQPEQSYASFAQGGRLDGIRIGVVREYMDRNLFTVADSESITLIERAIDDLRALGATIVDPGPGGALFQEAVNRYLPVWRSPLFIRQFRDQFPDSTDHFPKLIDMFADPSLVPHDSLGRPNIRSFGGGRGGGRGRGAAQADSGRGAGQGVASSGRGRGAGDGDTGGGKYNMETYLRERGDANIRTFRDLAEKANFWDDPHFGNRQRNLMGADSAMTMAIGNSLQDRFTIQTIVHTVFAQHDLDAVIYPTGNVPASILTNPDHSSRNDRPSGVWTFINSRGFPAMTVPAGFTTQVYDRVRDTTQPDSTRITGPVPARLPVGIDFLGLPFGEPMLLRIASAYEARTRHRAPPPGFGPLPEGPSSQLDRSRASLPRPHRRAEEVIVIDDHRDGVVLQIGKITQIIELAPINIRGRTK